MSSRLVIPAALLHIRVRLHHRALALVARSAARWNKPWPIQEHAGDRGTGLPVPNLRAVDGSAGIKTNIQEAEPPLRGVQRTVCPLD